MLKWFRDCHSVEDVKKTYRALCFKYHPDVNDAPDAEQKMKEINAEYEIAFNRFKNVHKAKAEQTATAGSAEAAAESAEVPEMFKNIINGLVGCDGVQIDIVGTWVWLTGNTFAYKDKIKQLGFRWASKKKAWYWHSPEEKATHSKMSLDEIKDKYGCQTFTTAVQYRIA